MRADLSGFFAVVNAIEQINRTINVFSIGLSNLEKFGNLLQKQSQQQPKRFGFPSTIQVRNLQIKTGSVVLNASSVIVQTQKKLSTPLQKPSIVKNTPKQEKSKTVTNVQGDNLATKPQKETTIKKPRKSGGDSAPSHVAKKTAAKKSESAKDQFQVLYQKTNNTALAKAISEHLSSVVLTVKVSEFPHKKPDNADLAKAISQQLSKVTFKTSERSNFIKNLTTGFTYGIGGTLGQRFTSGFEQGTGINSRFLGKQTGKAARYPFVLVNEFKKGFFGEDTQLNFKDKEDPDENTGNSSSSPPKKPSGGSGGTNKKTFGNNLLERLVYQQGQKLNNKVDPKDAIHAFIDLWAKWSKETNVRFAVPQFIETIRQKSDKESFSDKQINETLEKRKNFLKEEIAKEEKLPDNQKIKINETRQKKQLLSPKEQLAYIEFLEKHRKDLYKKLGKILFRFRGQNKLKFEELMAIYYYTESQGYKEMNQVLRGQSKPLAEKLDIKEKNLIRSADKNIKVATSGLNRLPGFKGKTYRGLDFATMGIDPDEYYKVGQVIEEKGFTSTTKNQTMRYPGNVVWEINANKGGKDISEIEAFTNEEVLFPPNSKFKVVGKRRVKKFGRDFWVIELDDVNNETVNLPDVQGDFEKNQAQTSASSVKTPQPQRRTRKRQSANIPSVELQIKPNEPNQVPTRTDTPGRPDGSGNQPPDRSLDVVPVGPVELPIGPRNNVDIEAEPTRGGGLAPLAGQLDTYQKTLRESLARGLEVKKAQTDIEIEPGLWVDVEQLNQGFVKRTQTQLILFWEKLRTNLGKEINRTLAGLLGTIPGAMLGRGLTGDPVGGYLGGMAGRLIAETGFQDVSNFRSLQQQGMSPATAEFWQQFGNNRKFLPNTLRKTAVGYVTGSVVGRGINDVMQATGANQLISALMPSWLETAIGDGINRTIKTIADPNIDLAIPNLPPAANKILSAPLHAVGKSVAAQGFLGNVATSFLDHQTKTALMPVREALTSAGQALGGEGLLGEYLGDRFTGLGIGAIQDTAKASGRGVAGMIAPGLPAEVRNFIADQVIKQGILDGTVRDQVAPFLASRAGTDVFARGVKVPVTGKIAGTINQTLDKYDPFAIAPKQSLTDEQILLNRQQRLAKKRTTAINAVENLFNRIDKSVDETTKAVVGIGNGFLGFFDNIRTKTYDFAKKTAGLTDNPITLIDQYVVYLDQLVQDAQKQAEETVKGIIPDYKNLTIPERKEAIGSYKEKVATEVKKFRMAIEDGESQIALEIGENILALVESTRKVYKDLLEAVPSDLSGTKSIEANQRYLTSVQTEVLKGQPNLKGRAKTGLMQLVGTETSEGFIKGIEERLNKVRNSGKELAESAIEGAKKRLGIQSPSKVFKEIGEQVVEGFKRGVSEVKEVLQEPVEQTLQATEKVLDNFASSAQNAFDKFYEALAEKFPIIKEFKDIILGFIATVAVGNVFQFLVNVITELANASFTAVVELESVRTALIAVTGSAEKGAKGLAFVREEAQKLGVNLQTLENAYAGFIAVTRYTPLQGKQTDQIFSAFTQTAALRGLSNEEQSRMFQAINQIISKRKLSAEEVRGQLGEIPGLAFESTLARSLGVAPAQLTDMMKDGLLFAEDILPKVAALYQSENAAIQGSTETTIQAVNRFQNAITNLQRGFEFWITGSQLFFNLFAAGIENLSKIIPVIVKYLGIFWAALFIDLAQITIDLAKLFASFKSGGVLFKNFAQVAVQAFAAIKKALVKFLIQFGLITLAVDAVGAAIYVLSNNAFPELKKGIEEATTRANQLEQALQNVGKATQAIPRELPKTEEEIVTTRNWNILGWNTGFNLEGTRQFLNNIDKALGFEPMLTTLGQQELANFQENVGGLLSQVDKNLFKQFDVEKTIKEIRELDKELTQARSRQFNIPAGDKKRYEAAIKEQQKLIEERDKKLSVTASFEKALQGDKAEIEKYLKTLDELVARRGITEDAEKSIRAQLEQRLKDIDKTSTAFDDLMSNLQKSVNALTLALRNLNEQASYFNETLQRNATNARVQFIRRARAAGVGSQVRDLGLDEIEQNTLEARIVFLRDQLGAVNELLTKPDFADVLTDLRQQAEDMGFNLENTATIDRLISENRSQQETAVLNTLKEQLRLQDELGQAEENLEQSISSTRSGIRDLNNSVEEFFFNLTQRIEEAIVEVDRILNKLKYTDIKNRLQRALVPGSDTFVNGLVSQIQGIFDRASGIVEQLLGQRSARINFVGERSGLQSELENFTRNLGGATEALELFRQGLLGSQPSGVSSQPSGGGGQPSASGRFALGKIGSTGIGSGPHLHLAGKDAKGNVMSKERLRELFSMVYVDGKPLSEQIDKITSGYGRRRRPVPGASTDHLAFDFGFPRGTPLEFRGAASSARSYFTSKNGNTVELTLPTGEKLLFLHLDSVADLGTIQRGRVNTPGNTTGNTPRRGMPNVPFASLIESAARQAGIDPLLFAALIKKESTFRQERKPGQILTSSANALGISQLKPETAKELGVNPYNVAENLLGGAKYLARMLERFGGNIELALSAYKAGPGNVRNNQLARGTVRDVGMVMQYYREFQQAGQVASANQPDVPNPPIPNVDNTAAQGLTNRLIQIKENQVNLGDADVRQEIESFVIQLRQTQQEILRQMGDSIRQSTQSVTEAQNSLQDIRSQYSPQTQSAQLETELRGVENQFRSLDNQLFEQERGLSDNIQGLDKLLGQIKPIIEILSASTNQVDQESASFLRGLIGRIEQDKTTYSGMLTEIQKLRGQLKEGKLDAENFVRAQAKLRTIQADLERIGTELSIAQQKNNLEQERAIALLQSRQQLELELLQISQDFEGEDRNKRLALAREQARLREQEIEYQFQSKSLSQETELINQRLAIAQNLSNLGKINELELLQSQKQLEQEILEIKKQYPDIADQERRINLAKEQARLREIGIENNFYNQRWQRQQELFDMESRIVEARATRLERSGQPFEAAAMREELAFRAELLRYEQEIEAIRQRYTDPADQQTRDELFRNAGILLELNLEQIDQQFKDLGETIRDTASGAFATFLEDTLTGTKSIGDAFLDMAQSILKSLAQIAARIAIGGLFRLLKLPIPGFADGGTVYPESSQRVPNFAEGDTVKSANISDLFFGNAQGNPFKGIQEALRKEGPQGVLAVFTPGEEILSLRTGEAQKYQSLKSRLGKNPLAKIGNFADGGTIGINESLLAGLNYGMPTTSRLPNNFGQTTQISNYGGDRSVTVNVSAPNPSAFNASERQIGRTIAEYLSRV